MKSHMRPIWYLHRIIINHQSSPKLRLVDGSEILLSVDIEVKIPLFTRDLIHPKGDFWSRFLTSHLAPTELLGSPGSAFLCAKLSKVPFTGGLSCSELLAMAGKAPTNLRGFVGFMATNVGIHGTKRFFSYNDSWLHDFFGWFLMGFQLRYI